MVRQASEAPESQTDYCPWHNDNNRQTINYRKLPNALTRGHTEEKGEMVGSFVMHGEKWPGERKCRLRNVTAHERQTWIVNAIHSVSPWLGEMLLKRLLCSLVPAIGEATTMFSAVRCLRCPKGNAGRTGCIGCIIGGFSWMCHFAYAVSHARLFGTSFSSSYVA